ncbi:MAG TPA: histidine phosphatase family protein [Solirubrobacteraceae bacterium]|jgi:broad specificity phosphatase PhoE
MILMARHGETTFNAERRFQGHSPRAVLTERGVEEARALAEAAAGERLVALYTSPLERARQTAAIVGERVGLEPVVDERFAETETGDWTERLYDEVDSEAFAAWERAGDGWRFPGGESLNEQQERVLAGLVDVTQRGELPALVVCHRGTIRVALCHTDQRGLDAFSDIDVPNGGLVRL